jgi:RimJ/RimL family protein N-acetyltransferase
MAEANLDLPATTLPVMNPFRLTLRPALLADIGAMMAIERSPNYEFYVARSEEEEHRAMLSSPSHAYWLGVGESGAVEAFAILRGLGDPHANLYLKRVAVARPGQGLGTVFLSLVLDEAFGPMGAERFHLDCFADNARARRSYEKLGLTRDGVLRQAPGRRDANGPHYDGGPEERMGSASARTAGLVVSESETSLFKGLRCD